MSNNITLDEIALRGFDERVQEIIYLMGGEHLSPQCSELTPKEMNAFGYSHKVCECGEKGLSPEEVKLGYCLTCVGTQYEAFLEDCTNNTGYEGGKWHESSFDIQSLVDDVKKSARDNTIKLNNQCKEIPRKELFGEDDNDAGC